MHRDLLDAAIKAAAEHRARLAATEDALRRALEEKDLPLDANLYSLWETNMIQCKRTHDTLCELWATLGMTEGVEEQKRLLRDFFKKEQSLLCPQPWG